VTDVNLTNPSGQTLEFSFTTNEQLNGTSVSLTGEESATFNKTDFTETSDNGTYTYTTTYAGSSDGNYTAEITLANDTVTANISASDTVGNDGATDFEFGVDVPPFVSGFEATEGSGMDVDVSFDSTDELDAVAVAVSGAENATLTTGDFTATPDGDGGYTYTGTYTGGTDGNYTVELVTADDGRTDGATGDTETVLADETAPAVSISAPDGGTTFRGGETTSIDWTATDSVDVDTVSIAYSTDGGGGWTIIDFDTPNDGSEDWTVPAVDSASVLVRVGATDTSGNVATDASDATIVIDSTAPTVDDYSVANPAGQDVAVSFDTDERLRTVAVDISGTESTRLTISDFAETDHGNGTYTYTYTATYAGSSDGNYTATLSDAGDDAGNDGATGQFGNVSIDTTVPTVSNFDLRNPDGRNLTVAFDSDERLGSFTVALSGAESFNSSLADFSRNGTTYAATYRVGSDGNYTATLVDASDKAGNRAATGQTDSLGIDTTPPTISDVSVSNPTRQEVRVEFDSSESLSSVQVAISGAETATLTRSNPSKSGGSYVVTYTGSIDGTYTATLEEALDAVGNDGAGGESGSVTVDATPPTVSNVTATNPGGGEIRVRVGSSEPLSTLETRISGVENETLTLADFTANGTVYTATYDGSTDGEYDVTLDQALDNENSDGSSGEVASVTIDASQSSGDGSGGSGGSSGGNGDDGSGTDGGENSDDDSDTNSSDTDTAPESELSVTVAPGANETTAVAVENADANERVGVAFENDTGSSGVNLSRLNLTVARPMNYELTVNASTGHLGETSDFEGHAVGFVEIDHSVGDSDIDGAGLTFAIDSRRFEDIGMDATDAVVYRYHGGHWNALPTNVVGQTDDTHLVKADSPGLSVFAVGLRDADLLSVTGASLSEPSAAVGTPVTVSATVTNGGNWLANESLAVTANGTALTERTVTVPAGETVTVAFDVTRGAPGTYGIAVDAVSAGTVAFSGIDEATTTRTTTRTTQNATTATTSIATPTVRATETSEGAPVDRLREESDGPNWWLFAGGISLIGSVAVLAWRGR
jgi:large repetitive protein